MARVRRCDKCGKMANVTRDAKRMTVACPYCGYTVKKRVLNKGRGG